MDQATANQILYRTNAEIHAAVNTVAHIAGFYAERVARDPASARDDLYVQLIDFFSQYDRMRTDQVEKLKADLTDALQWSVKPIRLDQA